MRLYSTVLGDIADSEKCVAAPLCPVCGQLPQMVKCSRILKLFRTMHKARTGKDLHFQLRWR